MKSERCWTNEPAGEDGSFRTTRDDGSQSYVVNPISEETESSSETIAAE